MGSKKYIHYGHTEFRRDLFCPIQNRQMFSKPWGGLWASPVDAKFGWIEWCEENHFREYSVSNCFEFTLSDEAKVLHIYSVDQLVDLPRTDETLANWVCLDFEQLLADGWDAVELHLSDENRSGGFMDGLYWSLYGWDCDSILVMNPEVVVCE